MQSGSGGALNSTLTSLSAAAMNSSAPNAAAASQHANGTIDADPATGSNVRVIVRCRPPTEAERRGGDVGVIGCLNGCEVHVLGASRLKSAGPSSNKKVYTFDQSYGALSSQEDVYAKAVQPLVEEVLAGFNCTVFAYGQTGTGKTYTMEGELTSDIASKHAGVIPRSVHTIFDVLENQSLEYSVKVSFLELYNEELTDLLADDECEDGHRELRIFEDTSGKRGMLVNNLEEVIVTSASEVFTALQRSWQKRRTAETLLNKNSSRSHCVFIITVHTKECDEDGEDIIKTGKLYLVDLAGSECVGKSGAQNQRAKEAGKINQSLLTLGRVINALVDKSSYIPYRDSKLTRLLQESLGGRAKTVIIATVSPSTLALDETLSTLEYAHRAKNIRNRPQVNQKMSKRAYMKDLLAEINSLKRDNEALRLKNGIFLPPEKYELMLSQQRGDTLKVEELLFNIKQREAEVEQLSRDCTDRDSAISAISAERAATAQQLSDTQSLLSSTEQSLRGCEWQLQQTAVALSSTQQLLQLEQVRVEEGEMLIRERAQTEEALRQQSTQLLRTVEAVIAARDQLHDKIERKSGVERSNAASLAALTERATAQHAAVAEQLSSFRQQYAQSHSAGQLQLRGLQASSTRHQSEREAAVSGWLSSWSAQRAEVFLKQSAYEAAASEHFDHFGRQAELAAQEADDSLAALHDSAHKHTVEVQQRLQHASAEQQAALRLYAQQRREQLDSTASFCSDSLASLTAVDSASSASVSESSGELSSCAAFLSAFQSRHVEQSSSLRASLVAQLGRMLAEFEQAQTAAVESAVSEVQQRLTAQASKQAAERQQLSDNVASLSANVRLWSGAQQSALKEQQGGLKRTADEWKQSAVAVDARLSQFDSEVESAVSELRSAGQSSCGAWLNARDAWCESLHSYSADASQHLQHIDGLQQHFAQQSTSAAQRRAEEDSTQCQQLDDSLQQLHEAVCTHVDCTAEACARLRASVVEYRASEYRVDTATGRTPEKRKIEHIQPTQLAATQPHDALLAHFRAHKKMKAGRRTHSHDSGDAADGRIDMDAADAAAVDATEADSSAGDSLNAAAHTRPQSTSPPLSSLHPARSHTRQASGSRDFGSIAALSASSNNTAAAQQKDGGGLSSIPVLSVRPASSTRAQQSGGNSNTHSAPPSAASNGSSSRAPSEVGGVQAQNENVPPAAASPVNCESSGALLAAKAAAAAPSLNRPALRSTSRLRFAPSQPLAHAD